MPFCYTDCPRVPRAAGGHTEQRVSTWRSDDLSLFCSQTCPHSKDPVWSQVFSFFVHSVAAEQLCLKVCLKLGSADSWEISRPRTGEGFLCTLGSSGSQPHSVWEGLRPRKPSVLSPLRLVRSLHRRLWEDKRLVHSLSSFSTDDLYSLTVPGSCARI